MGLRPTQPSAVPKEPPAVKKIEEKPAAPPLPPPPVAKREEPPAVVPKEEKPPVVVVKKEEKPEVAPVLKREEPVVVKEEKPPVKAVEPVRVEPAPVKAPETPVAPPKGFFTPAKIILIAAVLIILLGVGAFFMFGPKKATETASASPLGLRVERNAGQLLLSWNPQAPIMKTATRVVLSITDGETKEDVPLELSQLGSGSITYSPITNDVTFRLEATDLNSRKSVSETTRFLSGRPSNMPPANVAAAPAKPAPGTPEPAKPQAAPATATQTAAAAPAPQTPAPAGPQVTATPAVTAEVPKPDSLATRLRAYEPPPQTAAAQPGSIAAPPSIDAGGPGLNASGIQVGSSLPGAPQTPRVAPPSAAKPSTPAPAASTPAPARTQAQQARLIRRFAPVYPSLARANRISGIVRVQAQIGKDGRVKRAVAVSGQPLLKQAAVDAVMRWQYEPATLNGQPIDAETMVDINFTL